MTLVLLFTKARMQLVKIIDTLLSRFMLWWLQGTFDVDVSIFLALLPLKIDVTSFNSFFNLFKKDEDVYLYFNEA